MAVLRLASKRCLISYAWDVLRSFKFLLHTRSNLWKSPAEDGLWICLTLCYANRSSRVLTAKPLRQSGGYLRDGSRHAQHHLTAPLPWHAPSTPRINSRTRHGNKLWAPKIRAIHATQLTPKFPCHARGASHLWASCKEADVKLLPARVGNCSDALQIPTGDADGSIWHA